MHFCSDFSKNWRARSKKGLVLGCIEALFASKHSFCSIFQDIQDLRSSATHARCPGLPIPFSCLLARRSVPPSHVTASGFCSKNWPRSRAIRIFTVMQPGKEPAKLLRANCEGSPHLPTEIGYFGISFATHYESFVMNTNIC